MHRVYVTFSLVGELGNSLLLANKVAINIDDPRRDIMPVLEEVGRDLLLENKLGLHLMSKMRYNIHLKI